MSKIQNERKSQQNGQCVLPNHVVFNMSKIQNERKSQQVGGSDRRKLRCVQHVKDTK